MSWVTSRSDAMRGIEQTTIACDDAVSGVERYQSAIAPQRSAPLPSTNAPRSSQN
jgi:hypothetical protein